MRVPSLLVRAAPGWARPSGAVGAAPSKSLYVRLAEQLLGEGVYRALDAIQDEIIEAEDPLGPATIKFFARAGLGIARSWVRVCCESQAQDVGCLQHTIRACKKGASFRAVFPSPGLNPKPATVLLTPSEITHAHTHTAAPRHPQISPDLLWHLVRV